METGIFDRFKDAKWFNKTKTPIIVGGAGGIGSWLSLFLVRNNFKIFLYDFDYFEEHNIGGQLVDFSQIGQSKVEAVKDTVINFTNLPMNIVVKNESFTVKSLASPFMFSAFDNMEARTAMFDCWENYVNNSKLWGKAIFIDGRLAAESFEIYCVHTKEQAKEYRQTYLFSDKESSETLCTLKQTSHVAAMISGYMTSYFTNFISNINSAKAVFHVPFKSVQYLQLGINETIKI